MASVQKRGKAYQYTVSRMVNGKPAPIRKGEFRTKKEAIVAAAEVEAQLAKGLIPVLKKVPFDEYFENWFKLYKAPTISLTTLKHYEYSLSAVKKYFGDTPIQHIKRQDYQSFLNRLGNNKAKETVMKVHGHIRSCVKDAIEEQLIQFDFTRKTQPTWTVQAKKSVEKHLDYHESKNLLKKIWTKVDEGLGYSLLLLGLTSGMRFGEVVGLTRKDFNFVNNTISVNKTWGYKKTPLKGLAQLRTNSQIEPLKWIDLQWIILKRFSTLHPRIFTNWYSTVQSQSTKSLATPTPINC